MAEINILTFFTVEYLTAIGTFFTDRHIPRREIAGRILLTAIKDGFILTVLHNNLRAALGARNTDITSFLLSKVTLGKT